MASSPPLRSATTRWATSRLASMSAAVRSVRAAPTLLEVELPAEVGHRDPEQLLAPDTAGGLHGPVGVVLAPGRGGHPPEQVLWRPRRQAAAVTEDRHRLGGAHEQVCRIAAPGQRVREPLGGRALVAQEAEVPVRGAEVVADLAEGQQTAVGVGLVGEPAEHDGQQGLLDGGTAADPRCEGLEVSHGAGRVAETQGRQALARCLGREPGLGGAEAGDRGEQRPVEQPLVDAAHLAGLLLPAVHHLGDRITPVAEAAPEPAQVGLGRGHQVGAAQAVELDAVLERAQQPVVLVEGGGVVAADVAAAGEGVEGLERRPRPQRVVGPAVHELEELHAELDVAQPARAQLQLPVGLRGGDVLLHAAAHGLHVLDEVLPRRRLPDHRADRREVLLPQRPVTGHRPGLEQRLELPRLGPPLVVGAVALDRADQRPVLALRAERCVDRPEHAVGRGRRAGAHQMGCQARSPRPLRRSRRRRRRARRRR